MQNSYGGPHALERLVNACHAQGMAVVLDVVYNHLGPEGNYAGEFGFYFTDAYKTPWGAALNFEQEYSDEVRRYFIENALAWITDFTWTVCVWMRFTPSWILPHGLSFRNLARHATGAPGNLNREVEIIAESNRNDKKAVSSGLGRGGWALDGQWNDDFHHSLRSRVHWRKVGYYPILRRAGSGKAFREGFVYDGQYSIFRKRRYGNSSRDLTGENLRGLLPEPRSGGQSQSG